MELPIINQIITTIGTIIATIGAVFGLFKAGIEFKMVSVKFNRIPKSDDEIDSKDDYKKKKTKKNKWYIWISIIGGPIIIFILIFSIFNLIAKTTIDCNNEISEIILYLNKKNLLITDFKNNIIIKREDIATNLQGKIIFKYPLSNACLCTSEVRIDNGEWKKINSSIRNEFSINNIYLTQTNKIIMVKFKMKNMTDEFLVINIIK